MLDHYYYKLTQDITDPVRFVIGNYSQENTMEWAYDFFIDVFDGNGHTITLAIDLVLNTYSMVYIGLFNCISNMEYGTSNGCKGIVKNLTVDGYIKVNALNLNTYDDDDDYAVFKLTGGIAGISKGEIYNCINKANIYVNGKMGCVGGITGYNYGLLYNCINLGCIEHIRVLPVKAGYCVGGICGRVDQGYYHDSQRLKTLFNCVNYGFVKGYNCNNVGGIAGRCYFYSSGDFTVISNCINTGVVSGDRNVGCIVGRIENGAKIENCHFDKQMCPHDGIGAEYWYPNE